MASDSQCPNFLWTELVNTATYLINISPTRSNNGTPFDQLYYKSKPRVDHLRIFGSTCYVHVPKESRSKLENKTKKCFFLGYDDQSKAYRVYDPIYKKVHISCDIIFEEQNIGYNLLQQDTSTLPETITFPNAVLEPDDSEPISPTSLSLSFSNSPNTSPAQF
jgi:hypothetical protein